jgi:hypothetical protein
MGLGVDLTVFGDAPGGFVAVGVVQFNGDARQRSLLLDMDLTGPGLRETLLPACTKDQRAGADDDAVTIVA